MQEYKCNICGHTPLYKAIDLGSMPSANNLVRKDQLDKVVSHRQAYYWCPNCTLLQQIEFMSREELFGGDYPYLTGVNIPSVEDFKKFSMELRKKMKKRDLAVIVGSNDGTEIEILQEFGGFKKVIGVDPTNLAKIANERGLFTIHDFFGEELSKKMVKEYGNADFVFAKGVFAHIPDPRDMLAGMKNLISAEGTISIEVHYMRSILDDMMIDTLYAEHYFEWTAKAMKFLANDLGLKVADVEYLKDMRGGSLRFMIKKHGDEKVVIKLIEDEDKAGLSSLDTIKMIQKRADEKKKRFVDLIKKLKSENKRISVWTASAKVPTLLNFCGITNKEVDYAYDITEAKIGKFIPKVNIEIKREELVNKDMPDYLILGSWNYMDVALKKFANYMERGGKLINPVNNEIIGYEKIKNMEKEKITPKSMILEGKRIYGSLMKGQDQKIKELEVVNSQKVGHMHLRDVRYDIDGIEIQWTRVSSRGEQAPGATVIPVFKQDGKEYIVLLFKPQLGNGTWGVALPSGAIKEGESIEDCAARELEEEAGLKAGKMTWLMSQANFPERIVNTDQVFVAEDLVSGTRMSDYEEKPIKVMALTISEVAELLDKNKIQAAMTTAVLSTYLLKKIPSMKQSFESLINGK